jgi:para-aminobenzoate synthetase component 1
MFHPIERIALAALDRPLADDGWLRVVEGLHDDPGFWWLDSALTDERLGRRSFAGADPYLVLSAREREVEIDVRRGVRSGLPRGFHRIEADPIESARALLPRADSLVYSTRISGKAGHRRWHEGSGVSAGLELPFLGGAVGYLGYELGACIEGRMRFQSPDPLGLPDLWLAFVDRVLVYDHAAERLWVTGLGFGDARSGRAEGPRATAVARSRRAADELAARVEWILAEGPRAQVPPRTDGIAATKRRCEIASTVDASGYVKAVDTVLQEIEAGNVYQANYSQQLRVEAGVDPWALYGALRARNAAPFAAWLSLPRAKILSSSPERFLRLDAGRRVESRPIKGTRPRGDDAVSDERLARELETSSKDRAENLMIVDLVRNDLGRVCAPGSIAVPELMRVERYAAVHQMVSTVTGDLATGRDAFDLLRATFPPGSMTGAPKLAAMALLEELETVRRGVYAGALGYFDLRGGLDLSVVIRTLVWQDGRAHLHVGGGIVADSSPEAEYLESLDKAKAPLAAIEAALAVAARPDETERRGGAR